MTLETEAVQVMLEAIKARASYLGPGQQYLALSRTASLKDKLNTLLTSADTSDMKALLQEVLELAILFKL